MIRLGKMNLVKISLGLILFSGGCSEPPDTAINSTAELDSPVTPSNTKAPEKPAEIPDFVDVPALANKPSAEFEKIYGASLKITKITDDKALMPGEYRLYQVTGHPKGLSVRFYKNAAKRFNLLLGEPVDSAQKALLEVFRINVKDARPDKKEPLSEKWSGILGGVRFETAYAKQEKASGGFTMVHAEITK